MINWASVFEAKWTVAGDVEIINIVLAIQNAIYSIYIPVIHAAMEEATNQIERIDADELNALLACIRQLYALLSLIATCAQSI